MNSKIIFLMILSIILPLEIIFIFGIPSMSLIINDINATYHPSINQLDYTPAYYKLITIQEAAYNISESHEYKLHVYDCTQFSQDLVKTLRNKSIESRCVFGIYIGENKKYDRTLHTWVEITDNDFDNVFYVEATSGVIISDEDFKNHYNLLTRGRCI